MHHLSNKLYVALVIKVIVIIVALLAVFNSDTVAAQGPREVSSLGNDDALALEMINLIKQVSKQRYTAGRVKRFNQAKTLGCFNAKFTVNNNVPKTLQHGLFANEGSYPAIIRFANASTSDDGDKDLRGMSLRISNVEGDMVWGEDGLQDFILNSHPVLFAGTPEDFRDFIQAQLDDDIFWYFLNPFDSHLGGLGILLSARDNHTSPFDIRYWSTTPYQLGNKDKAVKYSVKPCSSHDSEHPEELTENYLQANMVAHLRHSEVCFDFMLQPQINAEEMPIEDASVLWDEDDSPFVPVARITFGQQEFATKEALKLCENRQFNPWQSLQAHRPLGRMNYVRLKIYEALAAYRLANNHKLYEEN